MMNSMRCKGLKPCMVRSSWPVANWWNLLEFHGIFWNLVELCGTWWNLLESGGTFWNSMESPGTRCHSVYLLRLCLLDSTSSNSSSLSLCNRLILRTLTACRCQILGFVARIRKNEVHNDNKAQKMTMGLMIDCLATLCDVWCRCLGGVFPELLMRRYNLGYLVSSLSPQDDCARFRIDPSI